jgi:hypothetical protein
MCRYSTGLGLSGSDALIQDFYSGECTNPIHLILDTQLTDGKMAIKAFVSRTLTLRKHQVNALNLTKARCGIPYTRCRLLISGQVWV